MKEQVYEVKTLGVNVLEDMKLLIKRVKNLEQGYKEIIANSHAYVLKKHGERDAQVHEQYRRMARRILKTQEN